MHKLKIIARRPRTNSPKPEGADDPLGVCKQVEDVQLQYGFKTWHDPNTTDGETTHLFDLVFIHGLTGDLENTWTHPDCMDPWPKTLIPKDFPGARVLSYGYDAYVALRKGPVSSNRMSNHSLDFLNALVAIRQTEKEGVVFKGTGRKPLIFIAHSLGGIISKDTLLLSSKSDDRTERAIFEDTLGMIFMGTPHNGSGLARWAKMPATALGVVKGTNKGLLHVLELDNEIITRIQNEFIQNIRSTVNTPNEIKIVSFYETLPMFHLQQIVSFESAVLPGYNHISIHADHRNMVKFFSEKDEGYTQVAAILRRWEPRALEKMASSGLSVEGLERYHKQCLASLAFAEMLDRRFDISGPVQDTCDWVFQDDRYIRWAAISKHALGVENQAADASAVEDQSGSELLLISGKPGSGKSTLMKNMFTVHTEQQKTNEGVCLGFFFNARGSGLEKSSLGMYRSLLFQLLRSNSVAFRMMLPVLREKEAINQSRDFKWRMSEIIEHFHRILGDERIQNVTIFIDGVDECEDNDDGRDIVTSFERSLKLSHKNGTHLRACLSSRPYRQIRPKSVSELRVEAHNFSDIALYVERELFLHDFGDMEEIKTWLVSKASGVFLWVNLVVKRLRTAWDRGCSPSDIHQILEELPPKLEDLYVHVTRSLTKEQLFTSSRIAQIVLFTESQVTPNDLSSILALSKGASGHSLGEIASVSPTTTQGLTRFGAFLTEITGGLFEISEYRSRVWIQVIHETVRDFWHSDKAQAHYGRSSSAFTRYEAQRIVTHAIRNYSLSAEVREQFATSNNNTINFTAWTQLCQCSPQSRQSRIAQAVPDFFVLHGLEYIGSLDSSWEMSQLRLYLEGWLFAYGMISLRSLDFEGKIIYDDHLKHEPPWFVEVAHKFLVIMNELKFNLGFSGNEVEQLTICMNNRSVFFEILNVIHQRFRIRGKQSMCRYHLACWAMMEDMESVVNKIHRLDSKRRVATEAGPTVSPSEVIGICSENGAGIAFTATFRWTTRSTDLRYMPDEWDIREGCNEFLRASNPENDYMGDERLDSMPFHLSPDTGYIALILAEETKDPAGMHPSFKLPTVFAVLEQDDAKAWGMETINESIDRSVAVGKTLRSKASADSLRTYAPDRRVGLSIWQAQENLQDQDEDRKRPIDDENIDHRRQKEFRPNHGPILSVSAIEQLEGSQNIAGLTSSVNHSTVDGPYIPGFGRPQPMTNMTTDLAGL